MLLCVFQRSNKEVRVREEEAGGKEEEEQQQQQQKKRKKKKKKKKKRKKKKKKAKRISIWLVYFSQYHEPSIIMIGK